jgi:hypothetical protein
LLTEWAERTAPTLDGAGWKQADEDAHPGRDVLRRWTPEQAQALMAVIRRLAEGLESDERAVLFVLPKGGDALRWGRFTCVRLAEKGLVTLANDDGSLVEATPTPRGRAVARYLESQQGGDER